MGRTLPDLLSDRILTAFGHPKQPLEFCLQLYRRALSQRSTFLPWTSPKGLWTMWSGNNSNDLTLKYQICVLLSSAQWNAKTRSNFKEKIFTLAYSWSIYFSWWRQHGCGNCFRLKQQEHTAAAHISTDWEADSRPEESHNLRAPQHPKMSLAVSPCVHLYEPTQFTF